MRKLFALLVLFTLPILLPAQNPSVGKSKKQPNNGPSAREAKPAETDQRGTKNSPFVVDIQSRPKTEAETAEAKREEQNESDGKTIDRILTAVIALAAIFQAVGIVVQILIYRKQSRLMLDSLRTSRQSANAALISSRATQMLERPWLLITAHQDQASAYFMAVNAGKTPAKILHEPFDFMILDQQETLPDRPPYENQVRVLVHPRWVQQQGDTRVAEFPVIYTLAAQSSLKMEEFISNQKRMWYFGAVRYQGTVDDQIYESRFCYRWGPYGLIMAGPEHYNDCK